MADWLGGFLISRPVLADLSARFGGMTSEAWLAMTPEGKPLLEGVVRLSFPRVEVYVQRAASNTLRQALRWTDAEPVSSRSDVILLLISFCYPLFLNSPFNSGPLFDDSGGKGQSVGTVLSPEKCSYLLDFWSAIDKNKTEEILNTLPVFRRVTEPNAVFKDARDLLEYLGDYAGFLREATARDSYYFSFNDYSL